MQPEELLQRSLLTLKRDIPTSFERANALRVEGQSRKGDNEEENARHWSRGSSGDAKEQKKEGPGASGEKPGNSDFRDSS